VCDAPPLVVKASNLGKLFISTRSHLPSDGTDTITDNNNGDYYTFTTQADTTIPYINVELGIHAHNDCEMAVANSVAAVQAGCMHVQGTINGYGERCGNANLISTIGVLKAKLNLDCVSKLQLKELVEVSHYVSEISNMKHHDNQPFVGASAFAHKGGVHVNAITKNPKSYEHIEPESVGNRRRVLISELSGKSSLMAKAKEMDLDILKEAPKAKKVLKLLQDMEQSFFHAYIHPFSLLLLPLF